MRSHESSLLLTRTTGLLTLEDLPHINIQRMKEHLDSLNVPYQYLDNVSLRRKFPMLRHFDTYQAIFEPTGGLLKADKCITAVQVDYFPLIYWYSFGVFFIQLSCKSFSEGFFDRP